MNGQFEAAWQLHRFLTERDIPYVVIGGIAVQRWGEPRLTIDAISRSCCPPVEKSDACVRSPRRFHRV